MECYSLKQYVNCLSPRQKNTTPLWIDKFAPSSYKHHFEWSSFEFQQKADSVWSCKHPCIDIFNSFIVTNWRLCISKLLLLVTSIEYLAFHSSKIFYHHREHSLIYTQKLFESLKNAFYTSTYKTIRVDYNQFNKHFCFLCYMCQLLI